MEFPWKRLAQPNRIATEPEIQRRIKSITYIRAVCTKYQLTGVTFAYPVSERVVGAHREAKPHGKRERLVHDGACEINPPTDPVFARRP